MNPTRKAMALRSEKEAMLECASTFRQQVTPRWLKIPAAVQYAGIGRSKLYELMDAGAIKSHLVGNARILDRESIDAFIGSRPSVAA